MPRYSQLDSARLRRDLGLARARKIIVYAGVGAAGLTTTIALVAAATAPGRSSATTQTSAGSPTTGVTSPGLVVPGDVPQAGNGGVPIAVSGGS